ncbi:M23 family metallopeptidase [uncultured Ramlibacter sp.]|uniref:M23 family metallopeptidase n=1 Tax=uncultured Ramlibacter sp. TaxID=260755 RepID=UPI002624800D|nr:M23 family metallopeptidase [uncultured Ramlibacter sp.]
MRRAAWTCALLALLALQACEREPVRTAVVSGPNALPATVPTAAVQAPPVPPAGAQAPDAPAAMPPAPMAAPGQPAVIAQAPPMAADAAPATDGDALLAARSLLLPVQGMVAGDLSDTYGQGRGGGAHEAIDILAARGTPVLAVDDGTLVKLFTSVPGGLTLYQFDPQNKLAYYYAHLDRYAPGLKEGMLLKRGDLVGYVGSTGNAAANAPHLHFAVFRMGAQPQWWKGTPVNPYPALRRAADLQPLLNR